MKFTTREDVGSGESTAAGSECRCDALSYMEIRPDFMQLNETRYALTAGFRRFTTRVVIVEHEPLQKFGIRRSRLGQSLIEFALVLPILVLIMYGIFDLGRAFFALVTVANASREGVRYMTRHPMVMDNSINNSLDLVRNQVKQEALGSGLVLEDALITINCVRDSLDAVKCMSGQDAYVRVQYDFQFLFSFIFPATLPIRWETRMMMP